MIVRSAATGLAVAAAMFAAAGPARAQGSGAAVDIDVDRKTATLDDEVHATVRLSGAFDRYTEPKLDGWSVAGQSTSQQIQIVNGRMSKETVLDLRLVPQKEGTLAIGPVQLLRGGEVVASGGPVNVVVRAAREAPPVSAEEARDLERKAGQHLFLHASAPRSTYYVGEPFVVPFELWFRRETQVQSAEVVNAPKLEGLLAEELLATDESPRVEERRLGSTVFRVVPRSVQLLTGLAPGEVMIDPMTVRVTAGDAFRQKRYTVKSDPFRLSIQDVPAEGRPEAWRDGNVGRFSLAASLRDAGGAEPATVQAGERLVLEVVVSGAGNLIGLKPPVLEGAEGFDVHVLPSTADDVVEKDEIGVHGRRVFQLLLSPRSPGKQTTPTVRFAFFDPQAARFRTLAWEGRPIEVVGRAIVDGRSSQALGGEDIGPILTEHVLRSTPRTRLVGTPLFWTLLAFPFGAWLVVEGRHRRRLRTLRDPAAQRSRAAFSNAKKRLDLASKASKAGLVKDFYGHVARTLTAFFEERANLPAQGMTHDELRRAAAAAGYPPDLLEAVVVELENADFARFAPAAAQSERMRETLDRVEALVKKLDAVNPERRP